MFFISLSQCGVCDDSDGEDSGDVGNVEIDNDTGDGEGGGDDVRRHWTIRVNIKCIEKES